MSKRLQVNMTDDAWAAVESIFKQANENFDSGTINYSDVISEMIISSKVDVKAIQIKHSDWRRSVKAMASKGDIDIDAVIRNLQEIKSKSPKKKSVTDFEGVGNV